MKRTIILFATALLVSLFAAAPALAATDTADATVTIVIPITVAQVTDMAFGQITPPSSGSQDFVLNTVDTNTPGAGDGTYISGAASGAFNVTGSAGMTVDLTPTVTGQFADAGLTLATLVDDKGGSLLLTAGPDAVKIGGTLTVASTATGGAHTGTIQLEVTYQ